MNRRLFMELVAAGLLAAYLPRLENEMQLGEIWEKIANNARLTGEELAFLKRAGNETQNRNNFVGGNTTPSGALNVPTPFFPIYSEVLQADTASLTIPIPAGFKHLLFMGQGRVNGTGGQNAVFTMCQFNGDTTATNYQWAHVYQVSGTEGAAHDVSDPSTLFWYFAGDGEATASYAGSGVTFIPHYRSSYYKMILTLGGLSFSTSTSTAARHGLWKSTAPIESIKIFPDPTYPSANIVAGTLISVYGIQ